MTRLDRFGVGLTTYVFNGVLTRLPNGARALDGMATASDFCHPKRLAKKRRENVRQRERDRRREE